MRLLAPLRLGGREAPNRIMFGPHVTNLGRGRAISERHVAYYARRAAGGAGVIVTEIASVHDSDWPYERAPLAADCADGWARVAAACRAHGALVLAGLGHAGGQGTSAYGQGPLWAPSGVPEVNTREMPKVMEDEDIAAVVAGFGAAAGAASAAGCDGVEVNAGQHSLVRQFCSGLTNQRSDPYGTDRTRFAREALAAVRGALGDGVLGLRVCADELAPWAGITPESAVDLVAELAPLADYLVVERGSIYSAAATRPDMHTPPGFNLGVTKEIRAAVDVPVFAQGSIVDAGMAEEALTGGTADGVEMTRAQIADAELGRKLASGRAGDVRPCVLCNQTCQVRDNRNPIVTCIGDPRSGHETEDPDPEPTAAVRAPAGGLDVLVVGGGPAGLEAARVAALRGHRVRLVDAGEAPGGAVRTAAAAPARSRLALLPDWLEARCRALGVKVEAGHRLPPSEAAAHDGPVIDCTGGRDRPYEYEIADGARVISARAFLTDGAPGDFGAPGDVAVWDPVGGPVGVSIAEMLAARDDGTGTVSLIFPDQIPGQQLALSGDLAPANTRLQSAGVRLERRATLRRVTRDGAEVEDHFGAGRRTVPAALVIDAGHRLPDDTLAAGLGDRPPAGRGGDAVAPRSIHEAVLDGRRAALALDGVREART